MHDVLHPLTLQPGVRLAAVISGDVFCVTPVSVSSPSKASRSAADASPSSVAVSSCDAVAVVRE